MLPKKLVTVNLDVQSARWLKEMAVEHTEGNQSLLLRQLIRQAHASREAGADEQEPNQRPHSYQMVSHRDGADRARTTNTGFNDAAGQQGDGCARP